MRDHGKNGIGTLFAVPCEGRCEGRKRSGCGLTGVGGLSPWFQSGAEWEGQTILFLVTGHPNRLNEVIETAGGAK